MKKMHPAKKYLMQIEKIDSMIENKKAEKEYWQTVATGTTMQLSEKVQTSSNGEKMTNAVLKILKVQEELDECIVRLNNERKEIISVLEQLNAKEYDLLHKVYVQYFTLKEYMFMKHISYSSVTFLHGQALNNVLKILERMKEPNE